jgi:hypothetical protein
MNSEKCSNNLANAKLLSLGHALLPQCHLPMRPWHLDHQSVIIDPKRTMATRIAIAIEIPILHTVLHTGAIIPLDQSTCNSPQVVFCIAEMGISDYRSPRRSDCEWSRSPRRRYWQYFLAA